MTTYRSHLVFSGCLVAISLIVLVAPTEAAADDSPAPRLALGLGGGGFFGDIEGGMGGLQAELGIQASDNFAIYYLGQAYLGAFVDGGQEDAVALLMYHSLMFEFSILKNILQLGAGPSLDGIEGCAESDSEIGCASFGPYFGLNFRVGLSLGALYAALNIHPTFVDGGHATSGTLAVGVRIL